VAAERERCLHLARYALSCARNTEWAAADDALDRIEGAADAAMSQCPHGVPHRYQCEQCGA
jgi:hypothetical protein